jgi:hypothetical protein
MRVVLVSGFAASDVGAVIWLRAWGCAGTVVCGAGGIMLVALFCVERFARGWICLDWFDKGV